MRIIRNLAGLLALSVVAFSGCSKSPDNINVTGMVTMNGKPLGNVKVDFHPDPDQGTKGIGSSGTTDVDGKFTLTNSANTPGAIVGHHRIIVTDLDPFGNVFVGRGNYRTESSAGTKETPKQPRFAEKYSNLAMTPLKQEVKIGMSPVTIEIKK